MYVKCTGMEGYLQVVEKCARHSMVKAAEEVKALPSYTQDGEVKLCMYQVLFPVCLAG